MKRAHRYLLLASIACCLVVGGLFVFAPAEADAAGSCSTCGGPVRGVGPTWGMGATCEDATLAARRALFQLSIQSSPNGCIPCNAQDTVVTPCFSYQGQIRTDLARTFQCFFCDTGPFGPRP